MKETYKIGKQQITFFGKAKGANNNKWNRVNKLASQFNELDEKLTGFIMRGSYTSEHARCALALKLMLWTGIRVGNEGSAEGYMTKPHPHSKAKPEFVKTYGLTSILWEHVIIPLQAREIALNFVGKKQVENAFVIRGEVKHLFYEYAMKIPRDQKQVFNITAYQLTKFIKRYVGKQFSPKDFRCLRANIEAWSKYQEICKSGSAPKTKSEAKAEVKSILEHVAEKLNNTPGVVKRNYVDDGLHDYVIEERYLKTKNK